MKDNNLSVNEIPGWALDLLDTTKVALEYPHVRVALSDRLLGNRDRAGKPSRIPGLEKQVKIPMALEKQNGARRSGS